MGLYKSSVRLYAVDPEEGRSILSGPDRLRTQDQDQTCGLDPEDSELRIRPVFSSLGLEGFGSEDSFVRAGCGHLFGLWIWSKMAHLSYLLVLTLVNTVSVVPFLFWTTN